MVASSNYEQYTPFPRGVALESEGFQSSEEESELHSPDLEQPLTAFIPIEPRYQSIGSDSLMPHSSLIAPPYATSQYYLQSQDLGAHEHVYPKEPPNTALSYNPSATLHTQSFTSSAYELAMPHRFPSLMDPAFDRVASFTDASAPLPQISSSSHLGRSPTSAITSTPPPQAHSAAVADRTLDASASGSTDTPVASSSRAGAIRNVSSGVIACRQCRSRKIRCDSTRPKCQNCLKRSNECIYDKVPKRRGPDKRPGTRKRSCKKRQSDGSDPSRRKSGELTQLKATLRRPRALRRVRSRLYPYQCLSQCIRSLTSPTLSFLQHPPLRSWMFLRPITRSFMERPPSMTSTQRASHTLNSDIPPELPFVRPFEHDLRSPGTSSYDDPSPPLAPAPAVEYPRKVWWESLLDTYGLTREQALKDITADLNVLFTSSNHWLTFFNAQWFLRDLFDPHARTHIQPALVYSCLAMAMLMKSSEIELGANGRAQALRLRDAAQAQLQESWNAQWLDLGLAEAAMVLALFETSAHPQHNSDNADAALIFLDKIIEALQLTALDARDPDTLDHSSGVATVAHPRPPPKRCECTTLPADGSATWSFQPAWDPMWTPAEAKAEETRRLCWSALMLVANHTVARAAEQREPLNLSLIDSSTFHLLFPGEYHQRRGFIAPHSGKDTVWALYCRSMLLWNCTVRFWDERLSTEERTRIACTAYVETRVVEEALDAHICNIDTALIYMCREFIANTRLEVTYLTRSILLDLDVRTKPVWNRRLAEEWLFYQEQVAKRVKNSLARVTEPTVHIFLRRPFQIGWFANQVATCAFLCLMRMASYSRITFRCLTLWDGDRDLLRALELAKSFLAPIEVLNSLWPCQGTFLSHFLLERRRLGILPAAFHLQGKALRTQLSQACASAGIPPPPPPPELPLPSSTRMITLRA
ncbi:hypothetical protein BC834DRAFT_87541 [Gloeopeniophorella convolvens]|nr:hypothetical protein BC834DRAFT_87541 [Gloeopeniophorella convolvens]